MSNNYRVIHKKSTVLINGEPKLPTAASLEYGELAINYAESGETISIKNSSNNIVSFIPRNRIENMLSAQTGGLMSSVTYSSQDHRIYFYDKNGTQLSTYVDTTDFITDGMVDSVVIDVPESGVNSGDTCLIITFNTDSGKDDIEIPLSEIFNPDDYYTKNETDSKFLTTAFTETQLSTGATVGTGNAITSIEVDGHEITATKGIAFATEEALSAHTGNTSIHVPAVTASDNLKVLQVVNGAWVVTTPTIVYSGNGTPSNSLGNNGDIYLQTAESLRAPDIVYQTDGTTGLLGHNGSSMDNAWQLENLDLSGYNFIRCYFAAGTATGDSRTPSVVVEIPLQPEAMGPSGYIGSTMTPLPFNRNREYMVSCAVDSTKTKFQVIHQNTLWDISLSDANSAGRYCYKIEGWFN